MNGAQKGISDFLKTAFLTRVFRVSVVRNVNVIVK
jgi:hypothetical protein